MISFGHRKSKATFSANTMSFFMRSVHTSFYVSYGFIVALILGRALPVLSQDGVAIKNEWGGRGQVADS